MPVKEVISRANSAKVVSSRRPLNRRLWQVCPGLIAILMTSLCAKRAEINMEYLRRNILFTLLAQIEIKRAFQAFQLFVLSF